MPPPTPPAYVAPPQWYYMFQGQRQGPIAQSALQQLIGAGQLAFNDMVWREGLAQWAPAGSMPEFSPVFARLNYARPSGPGEDIGQNAGMRMLLPVGRSGWAIAAGYLGLLSFVVIPAPLALIISIVAILDIRRDRTKHGMGRAVFGLVMGILGTIVIAGWIVLALTH